MKDALETAKKAASSATDEAAKTVKQKDEQIEKLSAELEEAKQTILKLSDSRKTVDKKIAATKKQAIASPSTAEKGRDLSVRRPYSSYKSIPEYAIQRGNPLPGQNNSMMDDDDIGWVD